MSWAKRTLKLVRLPAALAAWGRCALRRTLDWAARWRSRYCHSLDDGEAHVLRLNWGEWNIRPMISPDGAYPAFGANFF